MGFKPATLIDVRDEGTSQGYVNAIDFAGAGVSAAVSGSVATVTISGGGGGGGTPGGSTTQVQFNDAGSFGGDAGLTYDKTTDTLTIGGGLVVDTTTFVVDATTNRAGFGTATPTVQFHQVSDGSSAVMALDTYAGATNVRFRRGNGTAAAITRVATSNNLGSIQWFGAEKSDTSAGATFSSTAAANIRAITREDFDTAGRGTQIEFQVTAVDSTSLATAVTVNSSGLTLASGANVSGTDDYVQITPRTGGTGGYARTSVFIPPSGSGTEYSQTANLVIGKSDAGNTYYDVGTWLGVSDGSNQALTYSWGGEGRWTNAGGHTEYRAYLFDFVNTQTIFYVDDTDPSRLTLTLPGGPENGTRLYVGGRKVTTQADAFVGTIEAVGVYEKNDSNTRAFLNVSVKPTLNFGGSNANTTVHVLDVDTTNTATTGASVNLLRVRYGGSDRLLLPSSGKLQVTESAGGIYYPTRPHGKMDAYMQGMALN